MQLRTNRRQHAPAPSFVNLVKLRTKRRLSCLSPWSSGNPVKLRTKRRLICLSPWSSENPVYLRITRVGQATCHQCAEIRRVAEGLLLVTAFKNIVPANIEQTKKGRVSYLCYLNRILAAAPHVAPPRYAHTPCVHPQPPHPRQCAVRGQAGGRWCPGRWPLLSDCCVRWMPAPV